MRVTEDTALDPENNVTLATERGKREPSKVRTMYRCQKLACYILAGVIIFLFIGLVVVNHLVQIYGVTDTYYDENGVVQTEKYYVRKKTDGIYRLYSRKGVLMEQNEDGTYLAVSGNQYTVDEKTGACELYAVVDYDQAGGEVLGFQDRILMFPQITQANVFSIEVENENGQYRFYRDEKGTVILNEAAKAVYDQEKYGVLCVACGYTLSSGKLDFSETNPFVPRLSDGSVDYSQYGLAEIKDEEGNVLYQPARYTIVAVDNDVLTATGKYTPSKEQVYTVEIGSKTVSGGSYYFRLVGRDAVYLMGDTEMTILYGTGTRKSISDVLLAPVESLVTVAALNTGSASTYLMPNDFVLASVDMEKIFSETEESEEKTEEIIEEEFDATSVIVSFSFMDMEERTNTINSAVPYYPLDEWMSGYTINDDSISAMLQKLYDMEFLECKKLGITKESLEKYGFGKDVFWLHYQPALLVKDGSGANAVVYDDKIVNEVLISPKNENGNYYLASLLYDMIVEVDGYYLDFLEWDMNQWYDDSLFNTSIVYVTDLSYQFNGTSFDFTLDNSASDKTTASADKIKIYCEQYHGSQSGNEHLLDYRILHTEPGDAGDPKVETVDAISNFKSLYKYFISLNIEGDFDPAEFETNMGVSVEEYLKDLSTVPDAMLTYHAKDNASTYGPKKTENGKEVFVYEKDNEKDVILRFYRYSNQKYLVTAESLQRDEAGILGESDPTNVKPVFYVNGEALSKLMEEAEKLISEEYVKF